MSRRTLFRKEAVDRLRSPDEVDQLLRVVNRRSWIPLLVIGLILATALVWSIVAEIPETVEGRGILVYEGSIVPFQAELDGHVKMLAEPGKPIEAGAPLAIISRPDLKREYTLAVERRKAGEQREAELARQRGAWRRSESEAIDEKDVALETQREEIEKARKAIADSATPIEGDKRDLKTLDDAIKMSREMETRYRKTLDKWKDRKSSSGVPIISDTDRLQYEGMLTNASIRTAELLLRKEEIRVSQIRLHDARELRMQRRLQLKADEARIETEKKDLTIRRAEIERRMGEWKSESKARINVLRDEESSLKGRSETDALVLAPRACIVRELAVAPNSWVKAGDRLGMYELTGRGESDPPLACLAYFRVGDGMRISAAKPVQVSLDSVKREAHGSMRAVVTGEPGHVSHAAVESSLGSSELSRRLMAEGRLVQVRVRLDKEAGKYVWTSGSGPFGFEAAAGTTATVRVELESRRPIEYLLPFVRKIFASESGE